MLRSLPRKCKSPVAHRFAARALLNGVSFFLFFAWFCSLRLRGALALGVSEPLARQCPEGEELYWAELEREKMRQRQRKKRQGRKSSARSEKRSARRHVPKVEPEEEKEEEEEEEIPAEEFVPPAKRDGQVKALEKQLAANRRMSQKLEKTLVQKQMEAKQQQQQQHQQEFDVSTSSDSTTVDDVENESMATGQVCEMELDYPPLII